MKRRNGFVSNSSSSSFIVAVPKNKDNKITVKVEINVLDYNDDYTDIETEDDLKDYFMNDWGDTEEEIIENETYQKCLAEIKKGKIIKFISVSSDGDSFEEGMLYNETIEDAEISKDVVIIRGSD